MLLSITLPSHRDTTIMADTLSLFFDSFTTLSALAAAASATLAWCSITQQRKEHQQSAARRENERLLEHATTSLERAFSALMSGDLSQPSPPRDRLAWLTAARLVEEFKETKARINDPLLKRELESHEEHWRRQFYLKLEPLAMANVAYFKPVDPRDDEAILLASAVVLHAFADWPEGRDDPLDALGSAKEARDRLKPSKKWLSLGLAIDK
ncbi:hypothetical protein QAO71_10400 [Halopseudomonas sp. SMJS2]|uniref:hypothetical protein n=1 Tax=Halopseudomonas sp. SMJS2 TaxID=3041098 RepID=UPI0024529C04|nr:hypothetical protein [Halopseudomonas sp. SMJS2]WGK60503.1 hypothetical protein QAO71_10400 [Halopseudomonas sp. SMJS2]